MPIFPGFFCLAAKDYTKRSEGLGMIFCVRDRGRGLYPRGTAFL